MSAVRRLVVALVLLAAGAGLAGCNGSTSPVAPSPTVEPSTSMATMPRTVVMARVEYPTPAGPVTVRLVPTTELTGLCIERPGIVRVRDQQDRVGFAAADELPSGVIASYARCSDASLPPSAAA